MKRVFVKINQSEQTRMVKSFNDEKAKMDARKRDKLPIKRTFDENDFM